MIRLSSTEKIHAIVAGILTLALYGLTLCPSIFVSDSAEIATAMTVFGVPHPPGYPAYTLLSGIFVRLLPFADPAWAANFTSAIYAACAVSLLFTFVMRLGVGLLAAWIAALTFSVGNTFWSQAVMAEVYTFDLALFFTVLHVLLSTAKRETQGMACLLGFVIGHWVSHRMLNLVYLPALIVLMGGRTSWQLFRRQFLYLALGVVGALLFYAYLPLMAWRDAPLNIGDPDRWDRFWTIVSGAPYHRHLSGGTIVLALNRIGRFFVELPRELGLLSLLSFGAIALLFRRELHHVRLGYAAIVLIALNLFFTSRYNILDINVYFLPALGSLAILGSLGLSQLLPKLRHLAVHRGSTVFLVCAALVLGAVNLRANNLSQYRFVHTMAEDLLRSLTGPSLLIVEGDTTIHALWYLQIVEKRAPETIVYSPGHFRPWYLEQLKARYPQAPWPDEHIHSTSTQYAQAMLRAFSGRYTLYATSTVNIDGLLGEPIDRLGFGIAEIGLLQEILPIGTQINLRERTNATASLLSSSLERFGAIPHEVDMDTKSIFLQYALALFRNAQTLERLGDKTQAISRYQAVLRFDPDRHEQDIADDVKRGLGETIPQFFLGKKTKQALDRLVPR